MPSSPSLPIRPPLTRFSIAVETAAQAQAIQTFLWRLWLAALSQCRPVYPQATPQAAPLSFKQSYNSYGFATQTEHASTGFIYSTISSRNNDGQVNGATMGGGLLAQTNGYSGDGLGRIASISITGGTALTQSFGFESVGNLKSRSLTGGGRTEVENFTYDALDRLLSSGAAAGNVTALPDTGSFGYDSAGNLNSKAGLTLGYAAASPTSNNRLCGIAVVNASTCSSVASPGTGAIGYDGNGNITGYTRPTAAQSGNTPGADGALLALSGYTAFNLPTSVTKSLAGTVQASAEFFYDAGYQRVRQIKRSGAVQTGPFADDILYVVPGGFELHRNAAGQITSSIATVSGPDGVVATVSTQFDPNTGLPVTQASVTKRTVSLPQEHAAYIDRLVASGSFASASEVVRAGLRALQERDQAVERWLREEVVPAHDAMTADLARGLPAQAVFDDIRAHHAAAMKVPLVNAREDLTP